MQWTLIVLAVTVTAENVPHSIEPIHVKFADRELCLEARDRVKEELRTRIVQISASCVQTDF